MFLKKKFYKVVLSVILGSTMIYSCSQESSEDELGTDELASIAVQLEAAGFDTHGLETGEMEGEFGYVVEGDIFLTADQVAELAPRVSIDKDEEAKTEHYRTRNLVRNRPIIRVFFDPAFSPAGQRAFRRTLSRYNNLNLDIRFVRADTRAQGNIDIVIGDLPLNVLGRSGGFPRANGAPASTITLARAFFGGNADRADYATVIAHEIGHAIGLRHTDFDQRQFSCGPDRPGNEGDGGVGAIFIPGTPRGPESNSFMLACSGGVDRPFTRNDRRALRRIY